MMKKFKIATDYSEFPGLRHSNISDESGEDFYHKKLNQVFKDAYVKGEKLLIDLDDVDSYVSSFLDEAFGNLVYDFGEKIVRNFLEIKSLDEPSWKKMLDEQTFPQWERRRLNKESPKKNEEHPAWYRLVNSNIELKQWERPEL